MYAPSSVHTKAPPADEEEGEEGAAAPRAKPSGIGRVLNGGLPLACGHCKGETKGVEGELNSVDVSPQGVSVGGETLTISGRVEETLSSRVNTIYSLGVISRGGGKRLDKEANKASATPS